MKRPSAKKLAADAKALDVTTDYLLDNEQTEVGEGLTKEVFFRKLGQLHKGDQERILDIIDAWSKKS